MYLLCFISHLLGYYSLFISELKFSLFIYFFKRFYLFVRESERSENEHKQTEWQAEAEGEAGSLLSKEPDVGLSQDAGIMT